MFGWRWTTATSTTKNGLGMDVHSHLIPGIDDGVTCPEQAISAIKVLQQFGFEGAVLTPHIFPEVFDNDESSLEVRFRSFKNLVASAVSDFSLDLAAEYYVHPELHQRLESADNSLLRFGPNGNRILLEFPRRVKVDEIMMAIRACQRGRLIPVLAHVERYEIAMMPEFQEQTRQYQPEGLLLQINLGSVASQYGSKVKRAARHWIRSNRVDLIGTDWHSAKTIPQIQDGLAWIRRTNPDCIARHQALTCSGNPDDNSL